MCLFLVVHDVFLHSMSSKSDSLRRLNTQLLRMIPPFSTAETLLYPSKVREMKNIVS